LHIKLEIIDKWIPIAANGEVLVSIGGETQIRSELTGIIAALYTVCFAMMAMVWK
jgi:hypothetical protein